MVDRIAFRDRTVVLECVDVIVVRADAEFSLQQTGCHELQCRRNNQLAGLSCDQQATLIRPSSDLNDSSLKSRFVQVSCYRWDVAVGSTRNKGVRSREQSHVVATGVARREAVVQD